MAELFADVVGQEGAVAALRAAARSPVHAYLLVGPAGTGKRAVARSFAACLLCPDGGCGECRDCRLALAGTHPDLAVIERSGPFITVDDARDVARLAARTPLEAGRRVLVLTDFHLVERAAPALLKTIEEPPATTVFIILADRLVPELVTIASRCVTVELQALPPARLAEALMAEGIGAERAEMAARASGGRIERARLLVADPGLEGRHRAWRAVPGRLDGTGGTVAIVVDELLSATESVLEPLKERQDRELAQLAEAAGARGERGIAGRQVVLDRHRREQRRVRTDELRAGLGTLAEAYGARLGAAATTGPGPSVTASSEAMATVTEASRALDHNPNETLLLQALLLRLSASVTQGGRTAGR